MDQEKIGKFISNRRKEKGLTQEGLALELNLTSKAISKWECGKGLPDISIMLSLCETLDINIMDLLNGEISDTKLYKRKTKGTMKKKVTRVNSLKNNFCYGNMKLSNISSIEDISKNTKNVLFKVNVKGFDIVETENYYEIMMEIEDDTDELTAMIMNPKTIEIKSFVDDLEIGNIYLMKGFINVNSEVISDKVFIVSNIEKINE